MPRRAETWQVGGREVPVTSLDKLFWPEEGLTKGDLLAYYLEVASVLLPFMEDRPFIMRAWPDGVTGKHFYRWRVPRHAPEWLERHRYRLQASATEVEMAVVDDPAELVWVVNQGVIEMHPWIATRHRPQRPEYLFFDLDPAADVPFERVLEVGVWIEELLGAAGLRAWPKTSGGDGLHLFVPLQRRYSFERVRDWLEGFSELLQERHPGAVTVAKQLSARDGRVLLDYSQNAAAKSIVAPYSARARGSAPVSAPLSWDEVRQGRVRPADFTISTMPARLAAKGDLFADLLRHRQRLPDLR